MTRILDFADGFTSLASPVTSPLNATGFASYVDAAAYVTANGTAEDGDAYYNTTSNKVMVYENGAWVEMATFNA